MMELSHHAAKRTPIPALMAVNDVSQKQVQSLANIRIKNDSWTGQHNSENYNCPGDFFTHIYTQHF
jgi:hypothetical protein